MKNMKPLSVQPIPYQGSKRSLAPRICQLIPNGVETLYEPFAGSAAITIYAATHNQAERFVIGDSFGVLIDLWEMIIERPTELSERYSEVWHAQLDNPHHFNEIRAAYNAEADPVQLLYLVARCVKNAVRFNKHGHFTQSAGKRLRYVGLMADNGFESGARSWATKAAQTILLDFPGLESLQQSWPIHPGALPTGQGNGP